MRKGQVTLFIILGIVLLLVVVLFIFLRQTSPGPDPDAVTHDFTAVRAAYEAGASACVESEAQRVFNVIFNHGGFADPAGSGFVGFKEFPTRGSAIPISDDYLVPYWVEQLSDAGCVGDCQFRVNLPPLRKGDPGDWPSVEEQAEDLLGEATKPCIDALAFSPDYEVSMAPVYTVDVAIGKGIILYNVNREVNFTFKPSGAKSTIRQARAQSDADVESLYENAISVLRYTLLLNKTDTLPYLFKTNIQAYSMGADAPIPPMLGGTVFKTEQQMWLLSDVREELQRIFADNIPLVQVSGSAEQNIFLDPNHYSQAIYHTGPYRPDIIFTAPETVPRTSFLFTYSPDWPIDLKVSPGGYLLKPSGFTIDIPFLSRIGFYDYYFTYDVVVPVLVVMKDEAAFDGQGLSLLFAAEATLAGNEPAMYGNVTLDTTESLDFFTDDRFLMGGLVTITSRDAISGQPLSDVDLTYSCGEAQMDAGITKGAEALAVSQLPFCVGGSLLGKKDSYYGDAEPLSIMDDIDQSVELNLYPEREFTVDFEGYFLFKKWSADAVTTDTSTTLMYASDLKELEGRGIDSSFGVWDIGSQPISLGVDDLLTVIFTRRITPGEQPFVTALAVNYTNEDSLKISLAKGVYDVEGYLITSFGEGRLLKNFTIPAKEICYDGDCTLIPETLFNTSIYRGGIALTGVMSLNVTAEDYAFDTLTLKYTLIELDDFEEPMDLGVLGAMDAYYLLGNETLAPTFTNAVFP